MVYNSFMENFSKKRGRPRKIPAEVLALHREVWPELTTERSLNNRNYACLAFAALGSGEERKYAYLVSLDGRRLRWTILTALGRLEDEDAIRVLAEHICEEQMKTQDALRFIRVMRRNAENGAL